MRKNEIVERIVQIASKHGWAVKNNTKQESWKADVVVSQESYDVAFNISKAPRNVKETYTAMRKDRTCGCWLTLPSKNNFWNHEQEMPVFELEDCNQGDNIDLSLGYEAISLPLDDFIVSIITGHIRYAAEMTVNRLEVEFVENDCWKCGAANHVFFIHSLFSNSGIEYHPDSNFDYALEHPALVKAVKNHLLAHPELSYNVGDIKPRYSKTVGGSYMSFGCHHCDAIFGSFPLHELMIELAYSEDATHRVMIDVKDDVKVEAQCWYKVK